MPPTATVIDRREVLDYLDGLLDSPAFKDYGPNGLQVEGRSEISKLVTGVSACQELFDRALESGADAILVHHGIFWKWQSPILTGVNYRRVKTLIEGGLNLIAYHLPLDAHGEYGNNAVAARDFGLVEIESFAVHEGRSIGFKGRFPEAISADELVRRTEALYAREPLVYASGPDPVESLGIVSGGAQKELYQAIDEGLDAYLTGEVSEWVMNVAREAGIHYLAAGHYATERLGVRELGRHLAERFGLEVEFIDVPNPA